MKLLIVGASGQLARSLLEIDKPTGVDLVATGRPTLDLTAPKTIARLFEQLAPDVVINAAAYTAVDQAEQEPGFAYAINADGAAWLAENCARHGSALIHVSTDYVFDGHNPTPYREDDPPAPLNIYGSTKLAGEQRVAETCKQHIILRTSWVYSPFGRNFVKTMLRLAEMKPELGVVDDQWGCPTYAPDLAAAILRLAQTIAARTEADIPWGLYHAAATGATTWCGLAREVFRCAAVVGGPQATVRAITTAEYPVPARRPANSRLDCSKLLRCFGVSLPDWRQGVAACVARLLHDELKRNATLGAMPKAT